MKRGSIDDFDRELIPRNEKPHRKGCFRSHQIKTTAAHFGVMSSKISLRWSLKTFHLREVKVIVKYVVGEDQVPVKPATLERKDI